MKKVIKQENHHSIEVVYHKSEGRFVFIQPKSGLPDAFIGLEKSHAKEFCEAICPELETEKIQFAVGFDIWRTENNWIYDSVRGIYSRCFNSGESDYFFPHDLVKLYLTSTTNGK